MIKIFPIRILAVVIIAFIEKPHVNSQKFPGDGQLGGTHSPSLMSLISPRDIAELTQVATQFAAQTLRSNGDVISKSGPEVQPVNFNAHPSEIFGQSLTNMMHPARQNLAGTLIGQPQIATERNAAVADENRTPSNNGGSLIEQLAGSFLGGTMREAESTAPDSSNREGLMGMDKMVGQAMRLFSAGRQSSGSTSSANFDQGVRARSSQPSIPTLQQIFPGADKNFGFRQGEGCVPFIGEFMKMAYGNCVKRADERTWDTWGKEISNALMGGKIDLFRASKETCKMGAEREHCGQLRKAISECNILGSIQMATNLQRSVSRCDEVTGLIDQNPSTVLNQMNGLINGEMAQGFLNNFLG